MRRKEKKVEIIPDVDWSAPTEFPSLEGAPYICVDLETKDPGIKDLGPGWPTRNGYVVGAAVGVPDGPVRYYPFLHGEDPERPYMQNLEREHVLDWLRVELSRPNQPKLFANAPYDTGWLHSEGVPVVGDWWDIQVAAPLINENRRSYSLDNLAKDYCGVRKDEEILRQVARARGWDTKGDLWRMEPHFVGGYAEQDVRATMQVWETLRPKLDEEELWPIFQLETDLLPMLVDMRQRGVPVDQPGLEYLIEEYRKREEVAIAAIAKQWCSVNVWSAESLKLAFDMEGIKVPRTAKTDAPSFQQPWLEALSASGKCPLATLVLTARKYGFARRTFLMGQMADKLQGGRLYAQFHPLRSDEGGTVSGRFSSSGPNLQFIPARDPQVGFEIRSLFLAEDGAEWGSWDYSQQEPRLTVHYSALSGCPGAADAEAYYRDNEDADFHQMAVDMFKRYGRDIPRKDVKIINLGLFYGMGQAKLAASLGLTMDQTKPLLAEYHKALPFVRALSDGTTRRAHQVGHIRTLLGRRCRFPLWEPVRPWEERQRNWLMPKVYEEAQLEWGGEYQLQRAFTHKAMNRLIQGSAADQMKKAMRDMYRAGYLPYMQIHDEVCGPVASPKQSAEVKEIMEQAVTLRVPSKVDLEVTARWFCDSSKEKDLPWTRSLAKGGSTQKSKRARAKS